VIRFWILDFGFWIAAALLKVATHESHGGIGLTENTSNPFTSGNPKSKI
jgi:hypothetical protein